MGGVPPPPGGPPPPPMFAPSAPKGPTLPAGMTAKKTFKPETTMKRLNWQQLKPTVIKEESFWAKAQEDKFESSDLFTRLMATFGQKKITKKTTEVEKPQKKTKELKVLDGKSAQNLSIFLGTLKVPYQDLKDMILSVDDRLDEALLINLMKQLPDGEIIDALKEFKKQYDELHASEQFLCTLSDVSRLLPRLKHIQFMRQFDEMVGDIKPNIVSATAASQDILKSDRFKKFLELVLMVGNYMNSGSRNAQTLGFDISYLTRLKDTKNTENTFTMMHFLASMIEEQKDKRYNEVYGFIDDFKHIPKATRVTDDQLQKNIKVMKSALKLMEKDIESFGKKKDPKDKFSEVMSVFIEKAQDQFGLIEEMYENMVNCYDKISDFFCFDKKKKPMEDFFGQMNTFRQDYLDAVKENQRRKEMEEKQRKAKLAKEKAEREKEERKKKKQLAGLDLDAEGDQEGVMDSLLEALSSGKAFKKEGRRRTPRGDKAGNNRALERSRSRKQLVSPMSISTAISLDEVTADDFSASPQLKSNKTNNSNRQVYASMEDATGRSKAGRNRNRNPDTSAESLMAQLNALAN
uniref:Protein diaphanous homolog 2-like n=1 Tax=Phallusia mammillata TaxID=59560 RepID=A0A6F9DBR8_9ASCI|nr:protein diaphanous homolog 2-like [Phallusia mammillata]